jgi:hypothetical protein
VIGPDDETARPPSGPGFSDAVTFAWGDRESRLYGLARLGLASVGEATNDNDDARTASALAVLFAGREPVAATARGGVEVPSTADFAHLEAGGLRTTVRTPLREWTVAYDGTESGFDLTFLALAPPAAIDPAEPVARTGGMVGYEQLCRVHGTVLVRGEERPIDTLGQRGHTWGDPDWSRIDSTRTVNAWLEDGTGVTVTSVRPVKGKGHDKDAAWAVVLDPAGSLHADEARLSTTYDGEGHQRRAGLELWLGEDEGFARRAAGEVLCGSTFDLGQLRLDCAFFAWHMHGREGVGRYDLVRHA